MAVSSTAWMCCERRGSKVAWTPLRAVPAPRTKRRASLPGEVGAPRLDTVSGVDTYRGIAYQHAQAVLSALDVLESDLFAAVRVEGADDVIDIELLDASGRVVVGKQAKVRAGEYAWSKADLIGLLRRWANVDAPDNASFQFVTDGRLGPSAEAVRDALAEAAAGRPATLAELLGADIASAVVHRAARATVLQDPGGTGALLARAERQMTALLPSARSAADALEQARTAIDALFRLLLDRACRPDAVARVVTRGEICDALGIPGSAAGLMPWRGEMRDRYLAAACGGDLAGALPARVRALEPAPEPGGAGLPVAQALLHDEVGSAVVAGPTGAGKSTAARELRAAAAAQGRVVVVAHAETYLPGRVDALVADALAEILGHDVPTLTGRQVLAERDATLVIDGVSEVPAPVRAALAEDLRVVVATGSGAHVVLLGRELGVVREVLPTSSAPTRFYMDPFDRDRRHALAAKALGPGADDGALRVVLAQTEEALGDAGGNPMLLEMTVGLIGSGVPFGDRASLYGAFLDRLAAKTGTQGMGLATVVLGVCFARLLDGGRRYADPYMWRRLLVEAAEAQAPVIGAVDADAIDVVGRRSGLVIRLGHSETVAAVHDSFADYLAGLALARGAAPFPGSVQPGDEERLIFAAHIGGIDRAFADAVARRLPFALPRFAPLDTRRLGNDAPDEISSILSAVAPPGTPTGVALWRQHDGRVVAFSRADIERRWLSDHEGRAALVADPWVVGKGGPVELAVRLWRQQILAVLTPRATTGQPRPRTAAEARDTVAAHAVDVAAKVGRLLSATVPNEHLASLAAELGPTGLTAQLYAAPDDRIRCGPAWTVAYTRTRGIDVSVADVPIPETSHLAQGTLDSVIGTSAEAQAANRIRQAVDRLTGGRWL